MEFEQEKEKIRAIFKAKGIPESFINIPWIMETILSDTDDSLEKRIIKSNKDDSFIYVSKNNEKMLIKRCEDDTFNIIVADGNASNLPIKREIILNKYGMEQQRKINGTSNDYTIIKRTDSGTIVQKSYENEKLKSEVQFLDIGSCFLENSEGQVFGMPLITFNNSEEKHRSYSAFSMHELEIDNYEMALNGYANFFINKYHITREFYEMLSRNVSGVIKLSLLYNSAIAEKIAETEILSNENDGLNNPNDVRRLISALANKNNGSEQRWMGSPFPGKNTKGFSSWRKKAQGARDLRKRYGEFNDGLGDDTPNIDDGTAQGEDDGTFPDYD